MLLAFANTLQGKPSSRSLWEETSQCCAVSRAAAFINMLFSSWIHLGLICSSITIKDSQTLWFKPAWGEQLAFKRVSRGRRWSYFQTAVYGAVESCYGKRHTSRDCDAFRSKQLNCCNLCSQSKSRVEDHILPECVISLFPNYCCKC